MTGHLNSFQRNPITPAPVLDTHDRGWDDGARPLAAHAVHCGRSIQTRLNPSRQKTISHVANLVRVVIGLLAALWLPSVAVAQDTIVYVHTDAIGSVRMLTNQTGQVIQQHDYAPFGEEAAPPLTVTNARRFAGKERDTATGFDYFGARYYASQAGRFTSVDPVVPLNTAVISPQLWNRYTYVRNNPLRFTDPDGRCIWDICVAEGATVYAVGAVAALASTSWLASPFGQHAVSRVVDDTRTIITTAAGSIGSWFRTEKRPGTLGKPDHQATVEEEAARIAGTPEVRIDTPGGRKGSRRADAVGTNPETGAPEIVQVYRPTRAGNIPKREKDAAHDIEVATGVKPTMVPVRPVPKRTPEEPEFE